MNASESEIKVVSQITFVPKPPPKKQKTLDWFRSTKKNEKHVSPTPSVTKSEPCSSKKNPKQHNVSTSNKLIVNVSTVEIWKSELTKYNVSEWLLYDSDSNGKARNLRCKFCIKYEHKICGLPNFSDIFIKGSQNYKKSAVEDHAKNKGDNPKHPHTVAYKLYLEESNVELETRSQMLAAAGGNATIATLCHVLRNFHLKISSA